MEKLEHIIDQVKSNYDEVKVTLKPKTNSAQLYLSDYRYWIEVWAYESEVRLWVVAYDKLSNIGSFVYDQAYGEYFYYKNPAEFSYDNSSTAEINRLIRTILVVLLESGTKQIATDQSKVESQTAEQIENKSVAPPSSCLLSSEPMTSEQIIIKQALIDAWHCKDGYHTSVNSPIDFAFATEKDWLKIISNLAKTVDYLDTTKKIALRNLKAVSRNFKIERGYLWISSFCEIRAKYDCFETSYRDKNFVEERSIDISDIEYPIKLDNIENFVRKNFWYGRDRDSHAFRSIVLSAEILQNNGHIICLECGGDGFDRCSKCGGSGRESYTEGYFASGEKKIKTGQCSKCYGTGKIKCTTCNGHGEMNFEAEAFQKVKTCREELVIQRSYYYSTSFGDQVFLENSEKYLGHQEDYELGVWSMINSETLCNGITKLNKSEKVQIVDFEIPVAVQSIFRQIGQEHECLYTQNRECFNQSQKKYGELVCAMEQNQAIPIVQISGTTRYNSNEDYKFYIIDASGLPGETNIIIFCPYFPSAKLINIIF